MPNVIRALLTNGGREALAKSFGGPTGSFSWSYGKYFKIGTSQYTVTGVEQIPLPPDASYSDIQSIPSGTFWYRKTFGAADILFISAATIQFRCFLDFLESNGDFGAEPDTASNDDGPKNSPVLSGNAPIFFELGIFDNQNVMVGYGTFPAETKNNSKQLTHLVNINF